MKELLKYSVLILSIWIVLVAPTARVVGYWWTVGVIQAQKDSEKNDP